MPKQHEDNNLDQMLSKIFPEPSSRRYGRFFDVNQRSVQRWYEIPFWKPTDEQKELIEETEAALEKAQLRHMLDQLVGTSELCGVPDEILAAWLAYYHKRITGGREIE